MGNRKIDPQHSDNKTDQPPILPNGPIESDPMNPLPEAPPDSESKPADRPDLDWAEHED
jgi:hypothetical protein